MITPVRGITLGCSFKAYKHIFQPSDTFEKISGWFYPVTLYTSFSYKNWSFDYYQKLNSKYLEGLYYMGTEKVSYMSLGYSVKDWAFQLTCYFPFVANTFKNRTIEHNLIKDDVSARLKSKEKTFGISASWNFNTSGKRYRVNRTFSNEDSDNSVFNIKK